MLPIQKGMLALNILLLLASITAFILTLYAYLKRYLFMDAQPFMTRTFLTLMVFSATIAVSSLFGILTRKMKRSILIVNIVAATIFAIGFIGIGVASHFIPGVALGNQNCEDSDVAWIASGKKANGWGFLFCSSPLCYCQMTNYNGFSEADISNLNELRPNRNSHNNYFRIQQCAPYVVAMINDNYTLALSNHFGAIEQEFQCSGWCQHTNLNSIYIFSDVNHGKPKQKACFPALRDYIYKVVSVGAGFAYFLAVLLGCIIAGNVYIVSRGGREEMRQSLFEDDQRSYNQ